MRRPYAAMLGLVMVFGWAEISSARQGAVPAALSQKAQAQGTIRVIVELSVPSQGAASGKQLTNADLAQQQKAIATTQGTVLAALKGSGARVKRQFQLYPFIALEVTPDALKALEQSDHVISVSESRLRAPSLAQSGIVVEADLTRREGFDGRGWTVAILDTGVDTAHPAFNGRVVAEACFSTTGGNATSVCPNGQETQIGPGAGRNCDATIDGCDHGTHVAGIAAGATSMGLPIRIVNGQPVINTGVAPGANIIAIQVFSRIVDSPGNTPCQQNNRRSPCAMTFDDDYLAALHHIDSSLRNTFPIAAVNMSLGGGRYDSLCDTVRGDPGMQVKAAIDSLRTAGIATIVASGNEGYTNALGFPACISSAISVGSTYDAPGLAGPTSRADQVVPTSNSAAFLSLLAPGNWITSSIPGGDIGDKSGTSMAAPHVAGAWAIMKQKAPAASVEKVLGALKREGLPITDTKSGVTTPRIQILQALEVLADVYAKQSDPSCSNTDVKHSQTGWSGDWCNFVPSSRALDWCRQWVHPHTSAAWFGESKEDGSVWLGNRTCSLSVHCALPIGTLDVPYCDLATAVEKVLQGGTIGLISGQAFKTPVTLTKPSTLIAVDRDAVIGR